MRKKENLWFHSLLILLFVIASADSTLANRVLSLNSYDGTSWQLFSAKGVMIGKAIKEDYTPAEYIAGIVPGTIFSAYVAAGQEENPDFGDNIYRVDESKYNQSFWYRTTFSRPDMADGQHAILVFEGINRYASVYLNGRSLNPSRIKGHVMTVRYDITDYLKDKNVLAVKIDMPAANHIGRNDNFVNYVCPTYVASHSWDWMPYVPGLNCGITNDVFIEVAGEVTLRDPWVRTAALTADNTSARLQLQTSLMNLSDKSAQVEVLATIMPGNLTTKKTIQTEIADSIDISLDDITIDNPRLWWPNGSGEQNLYTCRFDVVKDGSTIDTRTVTFGIKKYEYRKENTTMVVYVNGKKVYCKGGNWGMSDYLLRVHGKDYDTRVRLHKDMHFNMIRLWTGCVTDEEFYEACDRYGIMVWDDFWLTGPYTGLTGPDDRKEFVANARDKVIRLRNHPSLAVWCGCNEGWPYKELNQDIINLIKTYDADDRVYIPNSHNGYPSNDAYQAKDGTGLGLSGSGWWQNFPPEEYFEKGIWGGGGDQGDKVDWGFRSELGMGAFTTWESFREFMPEEYWWPRNEMWEKHFFSDKAEYGGGAAATKYFESVQTGYGVSRNAQQFCEKAQLMNIEVMKALFEGWQDNLWNTASGLLFWMSQSAYPSFIWQTYDYYLDTTGTYWGAKKACEPLHIQWNCFNDNINIINTTPEDAKALTADIEVRRYNGQRYEPYCTTVSNIQAEANTVTNIYRFKSSTENTDTQPLDGLYFIRLFLYDSERNIISENFYWKTTRGNRNSYTQLNNLPKANINYEVLSTTQTDGVTRMHIRVNNPSERIAFAVRVRLVDAETGERILPVIMEENYFTLFAGEHRDLTLEFDSECCETTPKVLLKQYNHNELTDAERTGIQSEKLEGKSEKLTPVYNQLGQLVKHLPMGKDGKGTLPTREGIYIKDGKKTIIQ